MHRAFLALVLALAACGGGSDERAPEPAALVPALPADPIGEAAGVVEFGRVEVGRYTAATVYLENPGDEALRVEPPAAVGPFFSTVPPSGLGVPPRAGAALELGFVPAAVGPAEELLVLRAGEVAVSLRLRGEGVAAGPCALSAAPLDFGAVGMLVGAVEAVEVHAVGDGPCLVGEVTVLGDAFSLGPGPTVGVTLRPGEAPLPIRVRFLPHEAGTHLGALRIVAGDASVEVALSGLAVADGTEGDRPPAGGG